MKNRVVILLKAMIPAICCMPLAFAGAVPTEVEPTPDLLKALQSGGHIIYMRHGKTDYSQKDSDRHNLQDCSSQRNLSNAGRVEVTKIGHAIRALNIPVGNVLSSPYCRCKDTARLAFGQFQVEPGLQFSISKNKEESIRLGQRLHDMMLQAKTTNRNAVFVGHTSNLRDGLGVWPKPEGVIAVFKQRAGQIIFKGMIRPDEWPDQ